MTAPPNAQGSVSLRSTRCRRCVATATSERSMRSYGCARFSPYRSHFHSCFSSPVHVCKTVICRAVPRHIVVVSSDKIVRRGNGTPSWRPERDAPVSSRRLLIRINSDRISASRRETHEGRRVRSSRQDVERNDAFQSPCECLTLPWIFLATFECSMGYR